MWCVMQCMYVKLKWYCEKKMQVQKARAQKGCKVKSSGQEMAVMVDQCQKN